jgi:hypothetical protein
MFLLLARALPGSIPFSPMDPGRMAKWEEFSRIKRDSGVFIHQDLFFIA